MWGMRRRGIATLNPLGTCCSWEVSAKLLWHDLQLSFPTLSIEWLCGTAECGCQEPVPTPMCHCCCDTSAPSAAQLGWSSRLGWHFQN